MGQYFEKHKNDFFKKYQDFELINDINRFKYGNGDLRIVLNHFFEEIIFECCGKKTKICPMDVINDDCWINNIIKYIDSKPNFFTSKDEVQNIKTYLRNSSSKVRKVSNFPPKEAKRLFLKYFNGCNNINCLDTSCGFGSRMSAVLLSGNNYFGTDPNTKLFIKLQDYYSFLLKNNIIKNNVFDIRNVGSEVYIEDFKNKMDVCFTSPPYFNLEKYSDDNFSSTSNYDDYSLWVKNFVIPTVFNIDKYLKIGGYAMINIKNLNKKQTCYDDFYNAFIMTGNFVFIEQENISIKKKQYKNIKNTEPVMVFKKIK